MDEKKILDFIKTIRESFGASIAVYTMGNCYQFFEILKEVFPESIAYESGGHVFTKIGNNYYDIKGKLEKNIDLKIVEDYRIESLSKNKWTDERRKTFDYK
jgi:hypothetical protein